MKRCPLHEIPLKRGRAERASPTLIAGRKMQYHDAERMIFPFARMLVFCRTGPLSFDSCPDCRKAMFTWLEEQVEGDFFDEEVLTLARRAAGSQ